MAFFSRTVGTTEIQLTPYNPRRKSLVIFNNGSLTVFISQDPANIAAQGFPLTPGGSAAFVDIEGDEPELAIYAVSTGVGQDMRIVEGYGHAAPIPGT